MDWGNAIERKVVHDNGTVVALEDELHLEIAKFPFWMMLDGNMMIPFGHRLCILYQ